MEPEFVFYESVIFGPLKDIKLQFGGTDVMTIDSTTQVTLKQTDTLQATATYGTFKDYVREVSTTDATVTTLYSWTLANNPNDLRSLLTKSPQRKYDLTNNPVIDNTLLRRLQIDTHSIAKYELNT